MTFSPRSKQYITVLVASAFFLLSAVTIQGCRDEQQPVSPQSTESVGAGNLSSSTDEPVDGQYIVVFKQSLGKSYSVPTVMNSILSKNGISQSAVLFVYDQAIRGFAVKMSAQDAAAVQANPSVDYVEQDRMITLGKPGGAPGGLPAQTTGWGVTRVGGPVLADGTGKVAWIIDTGVDLTHPDLTVDLVHSKNFVKPTDGANDDNGHGTHVAGIIAAKNNAVGYVGVAAGATVVAVKVLNRQGSGTYSQIIAGVNYVAGAGKSGDVANMSLGGSSSTTLDAAVKNAAATGIRFAIAAGNEHTSATTSSPAEVEAANVYTVSAMDLGDIWAYYSNYGMPPVDFCAPGTNIPSLWKDGGVNTISGTSMAAPHVAGLLLLGNVATNGTVTCTYDGNKYPIAHH